MSNKLFFTALLSVAGAASLSAQAPAQIAAKLVEQSDLTNLVDNIAHLSLIALAGVVILAGIFIACAIIKSCTGLNSSKNKIRHTFMLWVILAVGMCSIGSGCTTTQQALAAESRTARAAETRHCPINHDEYWANELQSNRYTHYDPSRRNLPVFCRYCGQRIIIVHR